MTKSMYSEALCLMMPRTLLTNGPNSTITLLNSCLIYRDSSQTASSATARYGIPTVTSVKNVPFANSNSQRRAELETCRGGLFPPNPRLNFGHGTLLVLDFDLGHTFDSPHSLKT